MRHSGRHLDWPGCFNARDLGGLPTGGGGETRWRQLVRSDSVDGLTAEGWAALEAYGVRTVVDLRNADERETKPGPRPGAVRTINAPLDVSEDREFWGHWAAGPQFGTPLYYGPHLERFAQRNAEVLSAIAAAEPGGVVFHCEGGRDRAGQVALLLLALAGVPPVHIAADYALSRERLRRRYAARSEPDQELVLSEYLRGRGTTAEAVIVELLATVDVVARLRAGGLEQEAIDALRARLLGY